MFSIYLSCLVLGGAFATLSAFGHVSDRKSSELTKHGPVYTLRSLLYSLVGFGAAGLLLDRTDTGLGTGMEFTFAVLAGLLVGGMVSAALAYLARPGSDADRSTEAS